eukprot:CAMPEP_0180538026 /NCGR_PEP_ID=MMETSP1036_2-20121128/66127_1 /TAXON_ID=632150 /ORGANISM="Azadinium spinosum, Strain 3D9" /LENGTH=187 /DNA_ID=CAMNT_0022552655 /DNA_START=88 /DNA_END=648 /DNA_ORIENTATION=+
MAKAIGHMPDTPDGLAHAPLLKHPLEPITAAEIGTALSVFRASAEAKANGNIHFSYAKIVEPPKSAMQGFRLGGPMPPRVLRLVGLDGLKDGGFSADVDVIRRSLLQITRMPANAQSAMTRKDIIASIKLVKADPDWNAAIKKRGLDPAEVEVEPWPPGTGIMSHSFPEGARMWRCTFFVQKDATDN